MNIFYIDEDPRQCAKWMVDRHVVKMILETAQLLSTAHRVLDGNCVEVTYKTPDKMMPLPFEGKTIFKPGTLRKKKVWVLNDSRNDILYNATHINHPSAIWCRTSVENYNWLVDHLFALGDEYTYRYNKRHATMEKMAYELQSPPHALKEWDWTSMPCCMPDCYKTSDNPVINYRNYYRDAKSELHSWKKRDKPHWI